MPTWSHEGSCAGAASSPSAGALVLLLLIYFAFFSGGSSTPPKAPPTTHHAAAAARAFPKHSPLNPDWTGNGKAVTLGFGGDVHFAGAVGTSLATEPVHGPRHDDPAALLRRPAPHGQPRDGRDRRDVPGAPEQALHLRRPGLRRHRAKSATVSVATEANDHGMDCGPQGLSQT